jgi:hypothetical protein
VRRSNQHSAISSQFTAALLGLILLCMPGATHGEPEPQGPEAERLRAAKALFFDRKYAEARQAWSDVLAHAQGAAAATAAYWIARCSESLDQPERAYREYGAFLARKPADRTLAEEARTGRIGLAARLVKAGRAEFKPGLLEGLDDSSRAVRIFTAIQLAGLGECARAAPVLRQVAEEEEDEDLVQRARLGLLRCDPASLSGSGSSRTPASPAGGATRWVKVRIFEQARSRPKLSLNIPVGLADLVCKSLPEDARRDLGKKGLDCDNFWQRLKAMPPADILEIEGDEGERIQIWIE